MIAPQQEPKLQVWQATCISIREISARTVSSLHRSPKSTAIPFAPSEGAATPAGFATSGLGRF